MFDLKFLSDVGCVLRISAGNRDNSRAHAIPEPWDLCGAGKAGADDSDFNGVSVRQRRAPALSNWRRYGDFIEGWIEVNGINEVGPNLSPNRTPSNFLGLGTSDYTIAQLVEDKGSVLIAPS